LAVDRAMKLEARGGRGNEVRGSQSQNRCGGGEKREQKAVGGEEERPGGKGYSATGGRSESCVLRKGCGS